MIKSVIFDLDGTLLDTSEGVISSVKKVIKHFGYEELSEEELRTFIGPLVCDNMVRIYNISREDGLRAMKYFRQEYIKGDLYKAHVYPGIIQLLDKLKNDGMKLGVATYKKENQAIALLRDKNVADLFDVIHGADSEGKLSKTDVIKKTISDLDCSYSETIMVGDTINDAIGATGVGIGFIGVAYGFGFNSEADLKSYSSLGFAESVDDIGSIILKLS